MFLESCSRSSKATLPLRNSMPRLDSSNVENSRDGCKKDTLTRHIWFSSLISSSFQEEIAQGTVGLADVLLMSAQTSRAAPKAIIPPPMISHTRTDPPCVTKTRTMITTMPDTIQTVLLTILVRCKARTSVIIDG